MSTFSKRVTVVGREDRRGILRWAVAVAAALCAHGAMAFGLHGPAPAPPTPALVTEVELTPPPAKEEEPPPTAPAPPPARTEPSSATQAPTKVSSPVSAARAANVLVAKADETATTQPVDFVTDPHGAGYQGKIVARGGTGTGEPGARAHAARADSSGPKKSSAPLSRSDIVSASDLSRRPSLDPGGGCGGFYPRQADADSATATVRVVVAASGGVAQISLINESPPGQGFGAAARACLRASRFTSGLDKSGRAVKAIATVRVRFTR